MIDQGMRFKKESVIGRERRTGIYHGAQLGLPQLLAGNSASCGLKNNWHGSGCAVSSGSESSGHGCLSCLLIGMLLRRKIGLFD